MSNRSRSNRPKQKAYKPVPFAETHYDLSAYRRQPNVARERKKVIEDMYFRIISELSTNRFKWKNLPNTVDERYLEMTLFQSALCVFYEDTNFGYLALRGSGGGRWNMYDTPTSFTVTGNQFVNQVIPADKCVPIWGNRLRIPESDVVMVYATRLAEMDITIEVNARQMRRGYVITADESERLSFENIMRQHDEGQATVYGTRHLDMSKISFFPSAPNENAVVNMQVAKSKVWNECMTLLGINNANQDKRERLVASEVDANDEQVESTRNSALKARAAAAEAINRRFGLNVSVAWDGSADVKADYLGREGSTVTMGVDE